MNTPFLICLAALLAVSGAGAQNFQTFHTFAGKPTDGGAPRNAPIKAVDGNLWGTTDTGGVNNSGTIYKFVPPSGPYSVVYTFSALQSSQFTLAEVNTDGFGPFAPLVQANDSNLYGVTTGGGANGAGVIYEITLSGQFSTVYNFAAYSDDGGGVQPTPNADGAAPEGGLIAGSDGNLYGTASNGGATGNGAVFQFNPGTHQLVVLHSFSAFDEPLATNDDGARPVSGLVQVGNYFYGTAQTGGSGGEGTVFRVDLNGNFTVLYHFTAFDSNQHNADGAQPTASLVLGPDGNLWGTTGRGGANGNGTVFEVSAGGVFNVVHTFSALSEPSEQRGTNSDGAFPYAPLLLGADGNFYGTTQQGGANLWGTVFQLTTGGVLTTLHSFGTLDANGDNTDGEVPYAGLLELGPGVFYGTDAASGAQAGGASAFGTLFELDVLPNAPVITSPGAASGTAQTAFSYQITATNSPTSFGAQNLPAGLTLDASSGLISGALPSTAGADQVTLSATNPGGTGTAILTLTIAAPPVNPPAISSAASASGQVGQAFNYQIVASNSPASYSAAGLPSGLNVNATTGLISGTPTQAGTFSVTLAATNSGGAGSAKLNLTIAPALPVVSIAATTPDVTLGSGKEGILTVSLSAPQTAELSVAYTIKGTAINGADYLLLTGKKKFNPGITSKKIKIQPLGDLEGAAKKTVKITLSASPGYTLGATTSAKVKILAGP